MNYILLRKNMVDNQLIRRGIKNEELINAFLNVKRHLFVDKDLEDLAYEDYPLSIGYNQTISQPYIIALMIEKLEIKKSDSVLEIGTGSGYQTAIISKLAKEVYTVELNEVLYSLAKDRLANLGYKNIYTKLGDGYEGWKEKAPFNKIIVSCSPSELPEKLFEQLAKYGKMIIPLDALFIQKLYLYTKNDTIAKEFICDCRFVPMTRKK